jgi:hypothetical protein
MTPPEKGGLPARRYSDAEVRLLLERAATMQGHGPAAPRAPGLTLAQLEEIAAEAQIDVAHLRTAARELDMGELQPAAFTERLAGAPLRIHAEHTLPFEVDVADLGVLVNSIRSVTGHAGTSSLIGRTFSWNAHLSSGRRVEVRVTVSSGRTHVWIEERYSEVAGSVFGVVLGGLGGSVGFGFAGAAAAATGIAAAAVAFPVAVAGLTYVGCRAGYTAYVHSRRGHVHALSERIIRDLTALHDAAATE